MRPGLFFFLTSIQFRLLINFSLCTSCIAPKPSFLVMSGTVSVSDAMQSQSSHAVLNVQMTEAIHRTHTRAIELRSTNTTKTYLARQNEFKSWCIEKNFPEDTRCTVTGPKLHLFLVEKVIGRSSRKRGRDGTSADRIVGKSTVEAYASAIVDLYSFQCRLGINSHPHPRDADVQALLKNTHYERERIRRANYDDRGIGTILDGYSTLQQIGEIADHFWRRNHDCSSVLRNLVTFSLSHYAILRGESARAMELPDMHCVRLENEGFGDCYALVLVMRQGKMNQFGKIELSACLRNRDVAICPWGAVGFYFFWRWHLEGEPFPTFENSRSWYDIKLLKSGRDRTKPISYTTHLQAISSAFEAVGLQSRAKTHVGRGSGARMAELGGASEAQIRRLGRWNNQAMENCYLTCLPREAMRTLAGFSPTAGSFFLKRAAVQPQESLARKLFPDVELWLGRLERGDGCEANIAAGGFLRLLQQLRIVILQDSVQMMQRHPRHPIWKHSLFSDPEYIHFANRVQASIASEPDPTERRLELAMPDLTRRIDTLHQDLRTCLTGELGPVLAKISRVERMFEDLATGAAPIRLNVAFPQQSSESVGQRRTESCAVPVSANPCSSGEEPSYKMCRGIESVVDLWREWKEGIGGGPAVELLETNCGTKWCQGKAERRFFNRRKHIIDAVKRLSDAMEGGATEANSTSVAQRFEEKRAQLGRSLDWMSKNIDVFLT
jgi:hypothetical protein